MPPAPNVVLTLGDFLGSTGSHTQGSPRGSFYFMEWDFALTQLCQYPLPGKRLLWGLLPDILPAQKSRGPGGQGPAGARGRRPQSVWEPPPGSITPRPWWLAVGRRVLFDADKTLQTLLDIFPTWRRNLSKPLLVTLRSYRPPRPRPPWRGTRYPLSGDSCTPRLPPVQPAL